MNIPQLSHLIICADPGSRERFRDLRKDCGERSQRTKRRAA